MSFDLAVWHEPSAITAEQASTRYRQLVDAGPDIAPRHPQVEAFYRQLTTHHPEFDDLPPDDVDHSPWSGPLTVTDNAVLMTVRWSRADQVARLVRDLVDQYGLVLYDPQHNTVHHPPAFRSASPLVLSSCDGVRVDDPDQAGIHSALQRLSSANWFTVLEHGNSYIQVGYGEQAGTRSGWYALEHRDGSADRHFRTEVPDLGEVIAAFIGYAGTDDGWRQRFAWRKVDL